MQYLAISYSSRRMVVSTDDTEYSSYEYKYSKPESPRAQTDYLPHARILFVSHTSNNRVSIECDQKLQILLDFPNEELMKTWVRDAFGVQALPRQEPAVSTPPTE